MIYPNQTTLLSYLSEKLNISKKSAKKIIDQKRVFVNNKIVWIGSYLVDPAKDRIIVLPEIKPNYEILYEDENFVIVSKSPNLVVDQHPNSLEAILKKQIGKHVKAVHRIDKDTSGVVVFAKVYKVFEEVKSIWNTVEKTYYCICLNEPRFKVKEINYPVDGKSAISIVSVISKSRGLCLMKVRIFTGRKHQIRIHLSLIGHPVLGDYVYGPKVMNIMVARQMLHAYKIEFSFRGKVVRAISELPEDMNQIIHEYGL
ncbi:MAG: RluA family pseudouridine synthase [bacterium]